LVPVQHLQAIIHRSRDMMPNEALFYLSHDTARGWRSVMPAQVATMIAVKPIDPFNDYAAASIIELHSHNTMSAHFSPIDDKDETGFKIFAVIGMLHAARIEICVRVGVYGHFCEVPAGFVFQKAIEVDDVGKY
jgi:PRTRC genetic system protein A